ncbi:GPR1/FUN34/yaaH family-domain-containing protein [Aspergillus fruticulosus]
MSTPSPDTAIPEAADILDIQRQGTPAPLQYAKPKTLGARHKLTWPPKASLQRPNTDIFTVCPGSWRLRHSPNNPLAGADGMAGVTTTNAFVANFFIAAFGLVVTAQWELSIGNVFVYTVFSAFGLFYAGYGALLTPAFGVAQAHGGTGTTEYNNSVGFFMILWMVFVFTFLVTPLPSNIAYILVYLFIDLGFLAVAASYFAKADGHGATVVALQKAGGAFCFLAGLMGWYIVFHLLLQDSLLDLQLGDTSRLFGKRKEKGI